MDNTTTTNSAQMLHFRRMELKYLVNRTIRTSMTKDLKAFMHPDKHSTKDGGYIVKSLYFDTNSHMAYHEKLDGATIRHKLRIRVYGDEPDNCSNVRLEVKSKYLNFIYKVSVDISKEYYEEYESEILGKTVIPTNMIEDKNISNEFTRLQRLYNFKPKVTVKYRRQAFEKFEGTRIRVNFDDNLVGSKNLNLFEPLHRSRSILKYGNSILEIKVDGSIPYWLHMLIAKYNLQQQSICKYCYVTRCESFISPFGYALN